jgi:hypothetical protein
MSSTIDEMQVSRKNHRTQRNSGQTATPVLSAEFLNRHTSKVSEVLSSCLLSSL